MDDKTITCFMLYYGRKVYAEESIESFLRQTYPQKKLIIINDHPDPVWFEKPYDNVEIHNLHPGTFKNLNEKYLYAFKAVKTPWWAPWDSDDIWLPWHLENLTGYIDNTERNGLPRKIGITRSFFMLGKQKHIEIGWQMWGDCIWESLDDNGNFHAKCNTSSIENCDRQVTFQNWDRYWLPKDTPLSFFFRWSPNELEHRSAALGEEGAEREVKLSQDMKKLRLREPLHPHWKHDYIKMSKGTYETFAGIQSK